MNRFFHCFLVGILISATLATPQFSMASAFQIFERNASGLGRAFSGEGVIADDASVLATNPAGLALRKNKEVVFNFSYVIPFTDVTVDSASVTASIDTSIVDFENTETVDGNTRYENLGTQLIPSAFFSVPVSKKWTAGMGLFVDFANKSNLDETFAARFATTESQIQNLTFRPSIAWKVNKHWLFGASLGVNWTQVTFRQHIPDVLFLSGSTFQSIVSTLFPDIDVSSSESTANGGVGDVTGESLALTAHLGAIYRPSAKSRWGISYHQGPPVSLSGKTTFENCSSANIAILGSLTDICGDGFDFESQFSLPATLDISQYYRFHKKWAMHSSIVTTFWSVWDEIKIKNSESGETFQNTELSFRDTTRWNLGLTHFLSKKWKLRSGIAFDPTPVTSGSQATDGDRTILAAGAQYRWSDSWSVDLGYSHYFFSPYNIDDVKTLTTWNLGSNVTIASTAPTQMNGVIDVDFLAAQLNYQF